MADFKVYVQNDGTKALDSPDNASEALDFHGIDWGGVRGYFEKQSSTHDCWAACLSNALLARNHYVTRSEILLEFQKVIGKEGAKPSQYQELSTLTIQELAKVGGGKCELVPGGILGEHVMKPINAVVREFPVILGVSNDSHVIMLLAYAQWMAKKSLAYLIFEPTSGDYRVYSVNEYNTRWGPGDAFIIFA